MGKYGVGKGEITDMESLIEFWSDIRNVENACAEDIQKDILAYLRRLSGVQALRDEVERLTAENTVKSAAIKKYEKDAEYWYQESEKARSMFLAAHDEKVRLRKALEEAMNEYTNGQGPNTGVSHRMYKILKEVVN